MLCKRNHQFKAREGSAHCPFCCKGGRRKIKGRMKMARKRRAQGQDTAVNRIKIKGSTLEAFIEKGLGNG